MMARAAEDIAVARAHRGRVLLSGEAARHASGLLRLSATAASSGEKLCRLQPVLVAQALGEGPTSRTPKQQLWQQGRASSRVTLPSPASTRVLASRKAAGP